MEISFEFYPPKTPEGVRNLHATAKELAKLKPEFFSVTFGAGGSTREGTLDMVQMLKTETPISVAPHLACMGCSKKDLTKIIQGYQQSGFNRIVALRGDLPSGMGRNGELRYAVELVKLIRQTTGEHFHVSVAAYPEVHPQANNAIDDFMYFKAKVAAGANSAITQYFFNPDAYFYFRDQCIKANISIPIIPGIMPITQFSRLVRFSDMCGAEIPRWIRKKLESYGDDQKSIQEFGLEVVYHLCRKLLAEGSPGLHFYTLNHAEASVKLVEMLRL